MKFGSFEYLKMSRLTSPGGVSNYAKKHPKFDRILFFSFWTLLGSYGEKFAEPKVYPREQRSEILGGIRDELTRSIDESADRLRVLLQSAGIDPADLDGPDEWMKFIRSVNIIVCDNQDFFQLQDLALLSLHAVDRAIIYLGSNPADCSLSFEFGMSVLHVFGALEFATAVKNVRGNAASDRARAAANHRHKVHAEAKVFTLEAWNGNRAKYKNKSEFARDMTDKINIKDPKTILKWLNESESPALA